MLRRVLIVAGVLFLLAAGFLAWLVFYPGPALRVAARQLETVISWDITIGRAKGPLYRTISMSDIDLRSPDGAIHLDRLEVSLTQKTWRIEAQIQNLSPLVILSTAPAFVDVVSGSVTAEGVGFSLATMTARGDYALRMRNGPELRGRASLSEGTLRSSATIAGAGLGGPLEAEWSATTNAYRAGWKLQVAGDPLVRWTRLGGADGRVNGTLTGSPRGLAIDANADLRRIVVGTTTLDAARFAIVGSTDAHKFWLSAQTSGYALAGDGEGRLADGIWTGRWAHFRAKAFYDWTAEAPFTTVIGAERVDVNALRLRSGERWIEADAKVANKIIERLSVNADGLNLAMLAELGLTKRPMRGDIRARADFRGSVSAPRGTFEVSVTTMVLADVPAGRVDVHGRLEGERIIIENLIAQTPGGDAVLTATVPFRSAGQGVGEIAFRIRTDGFDPTSFATIAGYRFEGAVLAADLSVSVNPSRYWSDFSTAGWLRLNAASITMMESGLSLRDLVVNLEADGKFLRIKEGHATGSGGGLFTLSGEASQSGPNVRLEVRKGSIKMPEKGVTAVLESDLSLQGGWTSPMLTGEIRIPSATLQPPKKKDEKKKSEPPAATEENSLAMDVAVKFDRDVWYRDGATAIEFAGDLRVKKEPGGAMRLFGTIRSLRGDYVFYGKSFEIEQGVVTMAGEEPMDPQLNIRALFVSDQTKIKVILSIAGTVSQPILELSSEPPLEETDIISVLVTGAPIDDGTGEAANTEQAKILAANFVAEKLRQRLQNHVDIDVLKFKVGEEGTAAVTVGQNVTKDLFISYGQTLEAGGERRVEAEYTLTERWSLQGYTTSVGRYVIDLLFGFGFR